MTAPGSHEPFLLNLSGLLSEVPGAERSDRIERATIELGGDLRLAEPIDGSVRLVRTNRGILANAAVRTALALQCSRCLGEIAVPIDVHLHEEFLPSVDLGTGRPVIAPEEPDALRLTDHHELDLEGPVREAIQLAEPIAPLCRPDCPGLCIVCGERLEAGSHDHPGDDVDPRLEALRAFRPSGA